MDPAAELFALLPTLARAGARALVPGGAPFALPSGLGAGRGALACAAALGTAWAAVRLLTRTPGSRLAALLLARDAAEEDTAERKLQARAVPAVGGTAIALGLAAGWCALGRLPSAPVVLALALAWAVGWLDDRRPGGLAPLAKVGGQLVAALPLAVASAAAVEGAAAALAAAGATALAALVAMNLWNTFDNADGAAAGLALLAAPAAPLLAAPLVAFLRFNVDGPRGLAPGRAAPTAYLGDSGSHLVGLGLGLVPGAWPLFLVPALDLARVSVLRLRAGRRPWQGDRRHLAHRLQARGLGTLGVLGVLLAVALPAVLRPGVGGVAASTVLFACAAWAGRPRASEGASTAARPSPGPPSGR